MQEIGKVAHVANSGRVIVSLSGAVGDGTILCDSGGRRVARVMELIGPTSSPFASSVPLTNNIARHVGKGVFAEERAPRSAPRSAPRRARAAPPSRGKRRARR